MQTLIVTTLYLLPRRELRSWRGSIYRAPHIVEEVEAEIAEWAGVDPDEVAWGEFDHGEFLTIDGEPVGFVDSKVVEMPQVPERYRLGRH